MKGLVEPWQFPFFCEFDQAITSVLFMELVIAVENAGPMVLSSTCDQGGANMGLFKTLNVTHEAPWIPNPIDPNRKLFVSNDWVHVIKNFRNNLMDHIVTLENGLKIEAKKILRQLFNICQSNGLSCGNFLKDIFLDCRSSDRQTVSYVFLLISGKTAALLRRCLPGNAAAIALAAVFDTFSDGCLHLVSFKKVTLAKLDRYRENI